MEYIVRVTSARANTFVVNAFADSECLQNEVTCGLSLSLSLGARSENHRWLKLGERRRCTQTLDAKSRSCLKVGGWLIVEFGDDESDARISESRTRCVESASPQLRGVLVFTRARLISVHGQNKKNHRAASRGRLIYARNDEFAACHRRSVRRIVNDDFQAQGSFVKEGNYLRDAVADQRNLGAIRYGVSRKFARRERLGEARFSSLLERLLSSLKIMPKSRFQI